MIERQREPDLHARERVKRYKQLGIDVLNPNPDGSDYHLMNAVDDDIELAASFPEPAFHYHPKAMIFLRDKPDDAYEPLYTREQMLETIRNHTAKK